MTFGFRPASWAMQQQRTHTWCNIWKLVRSDGFELYLTDHDRAVDWYDGNNYTPMQGATTSAERRQANREATVEMIGIVSDERITETDLRAGLYRGAEITQRTIDWRWGHLYYERLLYLEQTTYNEDTFTAEAFGIIRKLQHPSGRIYTKDCPYILGGDDFFREEHCLLDISSFVQTKTVTTVVDPKREFTFTSIASFPDDQYRDGSVEWTDGRNAGTVQLVASYLNSTKTVKLYVQPPFEIEATDAFTLRPGCPGTLEACAAYGNTLRFGGSPYDPGTNDAMRRR